MSKYLKLVLGLLVAAVAGTAISVPRASAIVCPPFYCAWEGSCYGQGSSREVGEEELVCTCNSNGTLCTWQPL
jgi:hypothetical protein